MSDGRAEHNAEVLHLQEGDWVRVSARETSMQVVSTSETQMGTGVEFTLENRYGQYELRDYPDDTDPVLYGTNSRLIGSVEVEKVE